MRIFHLITVSEYGGAQSVVANICRELDKEHRNEVFIVYGGEGEAWSDLPSRIKRIRIGRHNKKMSLSDISVFLKLLYLRFKYSPDVVHLHSSKMGALGRLAFPKSRVIYTVHGFDSMRVAFRKFLFVEKLLAKRAYKIIGVSRYDFQGMHEENINGRLDVIYNGIPDFREGCPNTDLDQMLVGKLSGISKQYKKTVMCVARISKQKNVGLFLEIAKRLPSYAFVWIGNDKPLDNVPGNIFFLGNVPFAYRYVSFCDLFVLTSNYEGLPISILEAFCMGKPVIASAVGGIPEIIGNGVNGFALENNPEIFARHVEQVLSDREQLKEMGENARLCFLETFTVDKMVKKYREIYQELRVENGELRVEKQRSTMLIGK